MVLLVAAARYLADIGRYDLAALLRHSQYQICSAETWFDVTVPAIQLQSPVIFNQAMTGLEEWDQAKILNAVIETAKAEDLQGLRPERLIFLGIESDNVDNLVAEVCILLNDMNAVATGKARIQELDDQYKARKRRIRQELEFRGICDPNPFDSLWDWYHKWKSEFERYGERRRYLTALFEPLFLSLADRLVEPVPIREPTGWDRVDRALTKARRILESAAHEEDFQSVGLLCREVLISVGQSVYNPEIHSPSDGTTPSATDANRMIEAFFMDAAAGSSNETVRRYAKSSLQLALELQHRRSADFRVASLCLEATSSVVHTVAILAGRHDKSESHLTSPST
jgi:hypothetical protein